MNVGITGWRGFIGSYLKGMIANPILFHGELSKMDDVKSFTRECDRIYHVAGQNRGNEGNIISNNLISTGNLVLASKLQSIEPELIFISSKQVEWNPNSEYGLTKMIEEDIVRKAKRWCIFRVPNVYGASGKPFYNSVVATFAYQLVHGQEVTINNPDDVREFIFIEDVITHLMNPQFLQYVDLKGEIMSIGEIYEYLTCRLGEHQNLKKCLDYWRGNVSSTQR